jgi:hypothetical protein
MRWPYSGKDIPMTFTLRGYHRERGREVIASLAGDPSETSLGLPTLSLRREFYAVLGLYASGTFNLRR